MEAAEVQERGAEVRRTRADRILPLPSELRAFWLASAIGFALAFVVGWLKWRAGQTVYNWDPLSDPRFGDLLEYPGTYALLHTKAFFFNVADRPWFYPMYSPVAYPPFAAAVMAPIYLSGQPEFVFVLLSALWLLAAVEGVGSGRHLAEDGRDAAPVSWRTRRLSRSIARLHASSELLKDGEEVQRVSRRNPSTCEATSSCVLSAMSL